MNIHASTLDAAERDLDRKRYTRARKILYSMPGMLGPEESARWIGLYTRMMAEHSVCSEDPEDAFQVAWDEYAARSDAAERYPHQATTVPSSAVPSAEAHYENALRGYLKNQ